MTPVSSLIRVDLPAPFSPTMAWISPAWKVEVDGLQRVRAGEALVEPAQFEDRRAGGVRASSP